VWHRIRAEKSFAFEKAGKGRVARRHFNPMVATTVSMKSSSDAEVASAISNLECIIVGDGDDRGDRLEEKVKSLGLSAQIILPANSETGESISLLPRGHIGHAESRRGVCACDIPVAGGSCEALLDGQLGRIVDPNAPEELVEAITLLCDGSSRQRNAIFLMLHISGQASPNG
jgi:glycosyltransferase involved in cell wall biosynthesis